MPDAISSVGSQPPITPIRPVTRQDEADTAKKAEEAKKAEAAKRAEAADQARRAEDAKRQQQAKAAPPPGTGTLIDVSA
jgi:hypothetical protein